MKIIISTFLLKSLQNNNKHKCVFCAFIFFSYFLSAHPSIANFSQTVSLEAPTIVLNSTENTTVANITINSSQVIVSALTFSLSYDKEVLRPTAVSLQASGATNPISEDLIIFGVYAPNGFATNAQVVNITFEFIGAPGAQSPLTLNVTDISDENTNPINNFTQIVNGNISKACTANAINGCTNDRYLEYDPLANCDDGSCSTLLCQNPNYQKISDFGNASWIHDISGDGKRIVIAENSGIKLLEAQNGGWVQIATNLAENGYVMMTNAGDRIVIVEWVTFTSHLVKTYDLVGNNWVQAGPDLNLTQGNELSLSENGDHLLVAYAYGTPGSVEVYEWQNNAWMQKGNAINAPASATNFALYNDISADGNVIIFSNGNVLPRSWEIYHYLNNAWSQLGNPIMVTDAANNAQTKTCRIADDGKTILVSNQVHIPLEGASTKVRLFEWDGTIWTQRGNTIAQVGSPNYIELSGDASTFGVGGYYTYGLSVYKWNGTESTLVNKILPPIFDESVFFGFSYDGNALYMEGIGDDTPNFSFYYANDCHEVSQSFCKDTYLLQGSIKSNNYSSGNKINSNGIVDRHSDGDVEFESENSVELLPGFKASGAVNFKAIITGCTPE